MPGFWLVDLELLDRMTPLSPDPVTQQNEVPARDTAYLIER
jgi:hypothetical protein